jgi:hypothetical protein
MAAPSADGQHLSALNAKKQSPNLVLLATDNSFA